MTNGLEITGAIATLALLLPIATLATLAALALARNGSRGDRSRALHGGENDGDVVLIPREPDPYLEAERQFEQARTGSFTVPTLAVPTPAMPTLAVPAGAALGAVTAAPGVASPVVLIEEAMLNLSVVEMPPQDEMTAAEARDDKARLGPLYLARALDYLEAKRPSEAAEFLRKSIRAAVVARNRTVHAQARIELAELARAAGDLTTACEHWQIARGLFSDVKNKVGLSGAEELMRRHGCPTDWVLNDF